jgi:hypothetical protein
MTRCLANSCRWMSSWRNISSPMILRVRDTGNQAATTLAAEAASSTTVNGFTAAPVIDASAVAETDHVVSAIQASRTVKEESNISCGAKYSSSSAVDHDSYSSSATLLSSSLPATIATVLVCSSGLYSFSCVEGTSMEGSGSCSCSIHSVLLYSILLSLAPSISQ